MWEHHITLSQTSQMATQTFESDLFLSLLIVAVQPFVSSFVQSKGFLSLGKMTAKPKTEIHVVREKFSVKAPRFIIRNSFYSNQQHKKQKLTM